MRWGMQSTRTSTSGMTWPCTTSATSCGTTLSLSQRLSHDARRRCVTMPRMHIKTFHRIAAALIVAVSVGLIGCGGGAAAQQSESTRVAAGSGAPSGAYESRLPDATAIRLTFRDGGVVRIAMTEDGKTNSHDGKWILNGEVILVEGGEGMMMQLSWRGNALVTEFGGATLTFKKV